MFLKIIVIVTFATSAISRHVNDIDELDQDDEILFRAAYDSPSYEYPQTNQYDQHEYQYEEEGPGKLDLLKDGMWAIKAKIMEMKAINKALAANMLSTKLKLKELLADKKKLVFKPLKKHHHVEVEKPSYNYQPSYPQYQHYEAPAQAPQYAPPTQYTPPQSSHYAPPPAPHYAPPPPSTTYVHDPYYGH